jgi:NDP-sugar pyrophosphorylase family protein
MVTSFTPIILCGGKGKRLSPHIKEIPKPLVEVADRPILEHILIEMKQSGFDECILAIGYLGELIREKIGDSFDGMSIKYSNSGEKAGMLHRICEASLLTEKDIYVTYGDTFTKIDWTKLFNHHSSNQNNVTILTAIIQNPFGVVQFNNKNIVERFEEKPYYYYYIGHFLANKREFKNINTDLFNMEDGIGLVNWFEKLISQKRLSTYCYKGLQITFNTYTELEEANQLLSNYFSLKEMKNEE